MRKNGMGYGYMTKRGMLYFATFYYDYFSTNAVCRQDMKSGHYIIRLDLQPVSPSVVFEQNLSQR